MYNYIYLFVHHLSLRCAKLHDTSAHCSAARERNRQAQDPRADTLIILIAIILIVIVAVHLIVIVAILLIVIIAILLIVIIAILPSRRLAIGALDNTG